VHIIVRGCYAEVIIEMFEVWRLHDEIGLVPVLRLA